MSVGGCGWVRVIWVGVGGMGAACFVRALSYLRIYCCVDLACICFCSAALENASHFAFTVHDSVRACSCVQNRHFENSSIEM